MRGALALAMLSGVLLLAAVQSAHAQTETVLYSFGNQSGDGSYPYAGLIMDKKGNLYGTTLAGGTNNIGTVFKVVPPGKKGGAWAETVLYSFGSQSGDGSYPYAGLIMDKEGNLYGTTYYGGTNGQGTVFKVTSSGEESVLYSFGSQSGDGYYPYAGLIMDKKGNLYGTTYYGGANGVGTVFKVTSSGEESVLYSFGSQSGDGVYPYAGLIMDKKDNLYGTTYGGGAIGWGTVFKVTPKGTESVLYSFGSQSGDGSYPWAGLIMDKNDNLYGTTFEGGANGEGTVFELTAAGAETVLYSFTGSYTDGNGSYAGLVMDKEGNLYGASQNGPGYNYGVLFELSPGQGGAWTFTTLHAFNEGSGDGLDPYGTPILDKKDNVYGTTYDGGANGWGTVYKVTP